MRGAPLAHFSPSRVRRSESESGEQGLVLQTHQRYEPEMLHPSFIEPCLPMMSRTVPTGAGWAYEIKHDGFR